MDESPWSLPFTRPKVEPSALNRAAARELVGLYVALIDEGMVPHHALVMLGTMLGTQRPDTSPEDGS